MLLLLYDERENESQALTVDICTSSHPGVWTYFYTYLSTKPQLCLAELVLIAYGQGTGHDRILAGSVLNIMLPRLHVLVN